MKQQVTTGDTKSAHILSQAIVSNGFIFLSGQVHCNSELELVGETAEEKLAQIMKNIETILKAADATLDDIVKVVIYVTDMSLMPELNKAYPSYFTAPFPVREAICVKELPLGASVEMSVIAAKDNE
jgi:2-iminobutanoate/2-iminopropanoate deaminase